MVKYALVCADCDCEFDAWFSGSDAFEAQKSEGLVQCPACASHSVDKQIMAPAVKRSAESSPPDLDRLARKVKAHIAQNFDHVGADFATEARAMYYGDKDARPIWGQTTPEERAALEDEGVPASPLPDMFAPDGPKERKDVN